MLVHAPNSQVRFARAASHSRRRTQAGALPPAVAIAAVTAVQLSRIRHRSSLPAECPPSQRYPSQQNPLSQPNPLSQQQSALPPSRVPRCTFREKPPSPQVSATECSICSASASSPPLWARSTADEGITSTCQRISLSYPPAAHSATAAPPSELMVAADRPGEPSNSMEPSPADFGSRHPNQSPAHRTATVGCLGQLAAHLVLTSLRRLPLDSTQC